MPFQKGQSGNPKGRPHGSRHRLTELLLKHIADDFAENGVSAIQKVRADDPASYLRVVASLIPKEAELTVRNVSASQLSDDELAGIATGSGEGAADETVDPTQLN